METNVLTIRQLISLVECREGWKDKLFKYLCDKDTRPIKLSDKMKSTVAGYGSVIEELKSKKKVKPDEMPIVVRTAKDVFDGTKFIDVCFLNPNYVAPKKGLKPWGGKNPPKGHYNCNAKKHNQYYGFGYSEWSKIIDTKVIREDIKIPFYVCLAEILYEMTFHGFTEKEVNTFNKKLCKSLTKALKQIKKEKS